MQHPMKPVKLGEKSQTSGARGVWPWSGHEIWANWVHCAQTCVYKNAYIYIYIYLTVYNLYVYIYIYIYICNKYITMLMQNVSKWFKWLELLDFSRNLLNFRDPNLACAASLSKVLHNISSCWRVKLGLVSPKNVRCKPWYVNLPQTCNLHFSNLGPKERTHHD